MRCNLDRPRASNLSARPYSKYTCRRLLTRHWAHNPRCTDCHAQFRYDRRRLISIAVIPMDRCAGLHVLQAGPGVTARATSSRARTRDSQICKKYATLPRPNCGRCSQAPSTSIGCATIIMTRSTKADEPPPSCSSHLQPRRPQITLGHRLHELRTIVGAQARDHDATILTAASTTAVAHAPR